MTNVGYTLTVAAVRRVQPLLEELLLSSTKNEERVWKTDEPGKLAHRLREALVAAVVCASKDEACARFAVLRERYTMRAMIGGVKAELRSKSYTTEVEHTMRKLRLPEVADLTAAIGAAIVHSVDEIHFPNVKLATEPDRLTEFANWCQSSSWFIVDNYEDGFTLMKADPGDLKWMPK